MASLLQMLDEFPPFLCYALTRDENTQRKRGSKSNPVPVPTLEELCQRFEYSPRTFIRLAQMVTWKKVRVCHLDAFCRACGFDWSRIDEYREFMRDLAQSDKPWAYLSKDHKRYFEAKCQRWLAMKQAVAA